MAYLLDGDVIDRAAAVIAQAGTPADVPGYAVDVARALDEAGLLASPERDAAVVERAMRDAVTRTPLRDRLVDGWEESIDTQH